MGQPARGRSAKYGAVSRRVTARDGRGLTARGHMARELTHSDASWAHSSSICGDVCTLLSFLFVTNRNT